ncbi:transposase [Streptomyces sp. CEV 2-1]|uniref:transposase n=1 Tax=Streptomyces sp. CEV 2-1 TaxID=2485153 RepID=UPI0037DA58B1
MIDGIPHRAGTGVQWRDLPGQFGPWKTVEACPGEDPRPADRIGPARPEPDSIAADKAYTNGACRPYPRKRGIRHATPEKADSQAARQHEDSRADGRPASTKTATRSGTPSNEQSTGSSNTGPSPPDTTSAARCSLALQQQPWSSAPNVISRTQVLVLQPCLV